MATVFYPGQTLQRGDLDIYFIDVNDSPTNAYEISYALYYVTPGTLVEVLIGDPTRTPINPSVGEYYAAMMVPPSVTLGTYRVRWTFKKSSTDLDQTVVQEFEISSKDLIVTAYSSAEAALIRSLRIQLRDLTPDKHYHFRPPEHEGLVHQYNQVFGHIWEDYELLEYLQWALDWWNGAPPATPSICNLDLLIQQQPSWRTYIMWGAVIHAATALTFNWIAEEFSVGGETLIDVTLPDGSEVSLPIEELYEICHG